MFGRRITADPHGTAILATLCALADTLARDGAPIDYQRRRQLASEIELLNSRAWKVMCRAGGTPAGGQPKLAHARLWLWETLTGGLPRQAPPALRLDYREFLPQHYRFPLRLPATTVRQLNEHARRLLDTHGCHHEPLTWSPATGSIPLDHLPGPDPDQIDPHSVHAAIAAQPTQQRAAATNLGITLEHLHYIARKHPSEIYDPAAPTAPHRVRFAAVLGAAQLRQLIEQGYSLREIEASTGIYRRTLRDEAHHPRHPHPTKNPTPHVTRRRNQRPRRKTPGGRSPASDCPSIPDTGSPMRPGMSIYPRHRQPHETGNVHLSPAAVSIFVRSLHCDPRLVDAWIDSALAAESSNSLQAAALWGHSNRMVTDQAPVVPLDTRSQIDFVCSRVRNYQYSFQQGMLWDQLWVRSQTTRSV